MARRGIELEVKFAPAGEQTLIDLSARRDFPGWSIVGRHDEAQENTYFDTPDALLEAASCSLRRRILDGGASGIEWTFKRGRGPGRDGVARRREINALLPARKDPRRDLFPKEPCAPIERARKVAGAQPLQPLFTLLTTRHQIELARGDGARVALALDRIALADSPIYRETEIEIELFDGDEGAMADLAVWLMRTYGVLPMRGSKRGRALAWRRGTGLPVVAPALALDLLAERIGTAGAASAPAIALASPRGSDQARRLATALAERVPTATVVETADSNVATTPTMIVGQTLTGLPEATFAAWVKVGLPRPLLGRLVDDATAAGVAPWAILRRLGEYVVPSQRHVLDPAARDADLIVIDNLPPIGDDPHLTPPEQWKLLGWPAEGSLREAGAIPQGSTREEDHFFAPPQGTADEYLRVRLREDTAWVSYQAGREAGRIVTHEARPRVLTLLRNLGYQETGRLLKIRHRYRLGGWEIALDQVEGLGHLCEVRRVGGGRSRLPRNRRATRPHRTRADGRDLSPTLPRNGRNVQFDPTGGRRNARLTHASRELPTKLRNKLHILPLPFNLGGSTIDDDDPVHDRVYSSSRRVLIGFLIGTLRGKPGRATDSRRARRPFRPTPCLTSSDFRTSCQA